MENLLTNDLQNKGGNESNKNEVNIQAVIVLICDTKNERTFLLQFRSLPEEKCHSDRLLFND